MPGAKLELPMSVDEFEVMEHRLGWKHEYWDGHAHLSPQPTAIVDWERSTASPCDDPRPLGHHLHLRNVRLEDRGGLVDLYYDAFGESVEYTGYSDEMFRQDAQDSVCSFFGESTVHRGRKRDVGHPASSFLIEHHGTIVAAILIRPLRTGFLVAPIMVRRSFQRHGLGRALLDASLQSLRADGSDKLYSKTHLGNAASMAWHARHGFQEIPSYFSAAHRAAHFRWQAHHYEHLGQFESARSMNEQAEYWSKVSDQLQQEGRYTGIP